MSWDEKAFHAALRTGQWAKRLILGSPAQEAYVPLETERNRLLLVASALFGSGIEIKEAEGTGGFRGKNLFLPARMSTPEDYLLRVVFACGTRALGFHLPTDPFAPGTRTRELLALGGLLSVRPVQLWMELELPGCLTLTREAYSRELERRKARFPLEGLAPRQRAFEAVARLSLGESPSAVWGAFGPALASWAKSVTLCSPMDNAGLWLEAKVHLERLEELVRELESREKRRWGARAVFWEEVPLWGSPGPAPGGVGAEGLRVPNAPNAPDATDAPDSLPSGTELKGKSREQVTEVTIEENSLEENPVTHVFEKLQTADEYRGGQRTPDGSDELQDHEEALDEVNIRQVIRSRQKTRSIYRADLQMEVLGELGGEEGESAAGAAEVRHYDEWDAKNRSYRRNWCTVYSSPPRQDPVSAQEATLRMDEVLARHGTQVRRLRARLESLLITRSWRNRQMDGTEIDLEAMVDRYATWKSGHTPCEKLYQRKKRRERDLATLILLDSSLSTDSWVEGHRVLDVASDSILILGKVLEGMHDRVAIGAFHSNTRRHCHYTQIKDFDEGWSASRQRLLALQPTGYTRIGPALRHASALLERVPARKKFLLLISDGKPTDYDRYEGTYGITDIRQAIREANGKNIHVQALAIEAQAKLYLPRMFGDGNFHILPHPRLLSDALARVYGTLLRN